jgi:hypothetical protein
MSDAIEFLCTVTLIRMSSNATNVKDVKYNALVVTKQYSHTNQKPTIASSYCKTRSTVT